MNYINKGKRDLLIFPKFENESLTKYFEFLKNSKRDKDKIRYEIVKKELEKRGDLS